jgi:hypothetical protein
MSLESATYINSLNTANPAATDPKSQGDDHLRLIKSVLKNSFAGFAGMVIVTGTEAQGSTVNDFTVTISPAPSAYTASTLIVFKATHANTSTCTVQINALGTKTLLNVDGSALKTGDIISGSLVAVFYDGTQFYLISGNDRANRNGDTYTGTHDFTGATISAATVTATTPAVSDDSTKVATTAWVQDYLANAPTAATPSNGDNSTRIATTAFAVQLAFQAALPAQTGNSGKFLTTDGTNASWGNLLITRSARTSNTILAAADCFKLIDITSGTFTQTFTSAVTLGNGWYCYIKNSGTGDITLDPNGSQTIGGQTTRIMYPGEAILVICDGANFHVVVLNSFIKTFTSSGSFVKPSGYTIFSGLIWGGGAAGSKSGGASEAAGGGGGACAPFTLPASRFGTTETVTIGAGGTGSGGTGGNSTLGSLVTGYGGAGGGGGVLSAASTTNGGEPNTESSNGFHYNGGGNQDVAGGDGQNSYFGGGGGGGAFGASAGVGGNSVFGGAGGGGVGNAGTTKAGGTSSYGGSGGASGDAASGTNGTQPGGGGGATRTGAASGTGGAGQLTIWGVI